METFLIKAAQLLLSLSILVVIHEFGHFLFARLFKIKVEKFYLFFNPWFSLFKYKPKNSDTEYGIGWLPLGGYVKIAGMMDESMDKEQLAQPEQPWEFRSKPAWQRLLVMVGGVLFNFILAMFIFSMMLCVWGDNYLPYKNVKDGMSFSQSVKDGGFQDKDILVSADGKELVARYNTLDMNTLMQFVDAQEVEIIRDGKTMTVRPPADFADKVIAARQQPYTNWLSPTLDSVLVNGTAHKAGLQKGDSIVSIDGEDMLSFNFVKRKISKMSDSLAQGKTQALQMAYIRAGVLDTTTVMLDSTGVLGIVPRASIDTKTDFKHDKYSFFAAFPGGIKMGVNTLKGYVAQTRFVFSKEGAKSLGGFGALGSLFPAQWDWQGFWTMTAFLSIILAFMNILPIPALDGGHIMFLLYEVIARRKPNEKFVEYATTAGMLLLLALLLFANGNDIMRLFK